MDNDPLNSIADVILFIAFFFYAAFTIDYVLIRPARRFEPWWRSSIGWMFATLGTAVTVVGGLVFLSLMLGPDYWGRSIFRLIGYSTFLLAGAMLCVVYFIERGSAEPVLFRRKEPQDVRRTTRR